ncbi:hypothetical protein AR543_13140 [Paenibacillus bovis]|uniref:Uncharacterized protein n=1 Tax=Paenibacillus bovis TaxID=1616788 RepID=A0A172ZGT7_9BACL|nr:hypothetical protein AR543_13140 [Paenibacillus bovis]
MHLLINKFYTLIKRFYSSADSSLHLEVENSWDEIHPTTDEAQIITDYTGINFMIGGIFIRSYC